MFLEKPPTKKVCKGDHESRDTTRACPALEPLGRHHRLDSLAHCETQQRDRSICSMHVRLEDNTSLKERFKKKEIRMVPGRTTARGVASDAQAALFKSSP
jgi:hypothetical protein